LFHELRTYRPIPGRHGELLAHTKTNIVPLYEKYGFKPQGMWIVEIGPDVGNLVQLWEWSDLDARMKAMDGLHSDPDYGARMKEIAANTGALTDSLQSVLLRGV
jgi:NIPSNAP